MSEVREWLRRNNLEQYADAFEANDFSPIISQRLELHGTVQGEVEFVAQRQYQAQDGFGARPGARAGEPVQRSGDGELLLEA